MVFIQLELFINLKTRLRKLNGRTTIRTTCWQKMSYVPRTYLSFYFAHINVNELFDILHRPMRDYDFTRVLTVNAAVKCCTRLGFACWKHAPLQSLIYEFTAVAVLQFYNLRKPICFVNHFSTRKLLLLRFVVHFKIFSLQEFAFKNF